MLTVRVQLHSSSAIARELYQYYTGFSAFPVLSQCTPGALPVHSAYIRHTIRQNQPQAPDRRKLEQQ